MNSKLIFYLLGKKNGFDMKSNLDLVRESQYWTPEQTEAYQMRHLRLLLEHAYQHVPFYRRKFDLEGVKPSDIQSTADLYLLKPVRKKDIFLDPVAFIADNRAAFHGKKHHTGGTTGEAFAYYQDSEAWALSWALKMRTFKWGGYYFGKDRLGVMAGGSLTPQRNASFSNYLWRKACNCYSMPITHLDEATMEWYFDQLQRQHIRFLRGYPSALATFASFIRDADDYLPMKAVFTTAEVLFPHQREVMRQVFECEVYDTYGCGDGMGHATECELHQGLHVCPEVSVMQVVDDQGKPVVPGEEGEVVLTSLFDYTMPLIRYAPGDRAVLKAGSCHCGRSGMMLERIVGRASDVFKLSNGRVLNGLSIPFEDLDKDLVRFQIVQEAPDRVVVKIVPRDTANMEMVERIKQLMLHHCGEGITVEVCVVDRIEAPPSGKFRYIVSNVHQ